MRLAWATDIHLNFVDDRAADEFGRSVTATAADALLLGGDIAEAPSLARYVLALAQRFDRPIYFVLGNHDFYWSSFGAVEAAVSRVAAGASRLTWLSEAGVIELTPDTALLGHDSWADGQLGRGARSSVELNDYRLIEDFDGLPIDARFTKLRARGEAAAAYFRRFLPTALEQYRRLIVLTHVPPFREACWYDGRISDDDFLPHFTCKSVGDVLRYSMRARPDRDMTVLCGHTHGRGTVDILPNLHVRTGGAEYGRPEVQRPLILV